MVAVVVAQVEGHAPQELRHADVPVRDVERVTFDPEFPEPAADLEVTPQTGT